MPNKQSHSADRLEKYRQKRDFNRTPEPGESKLPASRQLVVQRHFARREHFDLRLEIDGVLVSWAVTRGPSMNPVDKRLAVRTEDHPLDYGSFEGTIPKGEYGGGTVMLWDEGSYTPMMPDPSKALEAGQLKFIAHGQRLQGSWVLVHMKKSPGNWLLIKENDAFADRSANADLTKRFTRSVTSGRTRQEIEANPDLTKEQSQTSVAIAVPAFVKPQLCDSEQEVPRGRDWLYEMKYDGYRLQLARSADKVKLYSRNGLDWTGRFPLLTTAARQLKCESCLLDGEAVVFDKKGLSDFPALVNALEQAQVEAVQFVAFDMLMLNDCDLRERPLVERKAELKRLMNKVKSPLHHAHYVIGDGVALFDEISASGGEGIVAKRLDSRYRSGRGSAWCKVKSERRIDALVVGYMPSTIGESFASLVAAIPEGGGYQYIGRIGTGYNVRKRKQLDPFLLGAVTTVPEVFTNTDKLPRGVRFIKPWPWAEIQYGGWTADTQMRHARFLGLREDLRPEKISLAKPPARSRRKRPVTKPPLLTHPDRVVYPAEGITKRDIAEYYASVTDRLFPYLRDRPASLLRAPDGIGKGTFFQRHPLAGAQTGLGTMPGSDDEPYLVVKEKVGIATACQFGTIEFHTWMVRDVAPTRADRMVFDLDPDEGLDFSVVKEAALLVKDYLSAVKLRSWLLATGGKGLHLVIPLDGKLTVDQVSNFSANLARGICKQEPKRFVATMSKRLRKGKVFLDWMRNRRGATAIVPWSLRARPGAPAAVPLAWSELKSLQSAADFNWALAPKRKDPWGDFGKNPQTIAAGTLKYLNAGS